RAELDLTLSATGFDVTLPGDELPVGQLHPTTQVRRIVEDAFLGLGYEIRDDREVETVEYNFDKLAFPPTHSSRSPRDTFFLDDDVLLRTETSPSQIHHLESHEPPVYMVSIGRVYRRDAITPTRFPIFHQFEGLAVDKGLALSDLKGTLLHVMRALFGDDRRVRFRTHYFPFTEPSIEPDVSCGVCGGPGCPTPSRSTCRSTSSPTGSPSRPPKSRTSSAAVFPTPTATSASIASAESSRQASIRTPTGCSSAASTSARPSRGRSSAERGTSARARTSPSRSPEPCSRTGPSSSARSCAAPSPRG